MNKNVKFVLSVAAISIVTSVIVSALHTAYNKSKTTLPAASATPAASTPTV